MEPVRCSERCHLPRRDAQQTIVTSSLTPEQLAAITASQPPLSLVPDANNTNVGEARWTYRVADRALDFLADGEALTCPASVVCGQTRPHHRRSGQIVFSSSPSNLPSRSSGWSWMPLNRTLLLESCRLLANLITFRSGRSQTLRTAPVRPDICWKEHGGLFLDTGTEPVARSRETWMKVTYLIAISFATFGWLWFIGWIVTKVF